MFLDLFSNIMLMHVYPCSLSPLFTSAAFYLFLSSPQMLFCYQDLVHVFVGHLEVENLPCFLRQGFNPFISKLAFKVLDGNLTVQQGKMGVPQTQYETENLMISGKSLQHHGLAHITD